MSHEATTDNPYTRGIAGTQAAGLSPSTDRFNLKELTAGLGTTWQTMGVAHQRHNVPLSARERG